MDNLISELQKDVYDKITYIKENFVEAAVQGHPFFGGTATPGFDGTASTDEARFINAIFGGYTAFNTAYASYISVPATNADFDNMVLIRDVNDPPSGVRNSYSNISDYGTSLSNLTLSNLPSTYNMEINLSKLLGTESTPLTAMLDKIRKLYSLFDPSVYTRYRAFVTSTDTTRNIPTPSNKLTLHTYTTAGHDGSGYVVQDEERFNGIKDLMMSLFTDKVLVTTKSFVTSGSGRTLDNVVVLNATERKDQGVGTNDTVIRLKHNNRAVNTFQYTNEVTLPTPQATSSVRITFQYKMEASSDSSYMTTGTMNATTTIGNTVQNRSLPVTSSWQTGTLVYEGVTSTSTVKVKFGMNPAAPTGKVRSILLTNVKAEYFENTADALSNAVVLPILVETDLFAVRRVLRLYELMTNMLIASNIYQRSSGSSAAETLANLCYMQFAAAKLNVSIDVNGSNNDTVPDLTKMLNTRMKAVSTASDRINQLDTITSDFRMTIKSENDKLQGRQEREKKALTMMYVTLAVSCVVVLVSVASYFSPMEKARKLYLIGIAFSIALIAFVIINIVFNKQVEGFYAIADTERPRVFNSRNNANNVLNEVDSITAIAISFAGDYLDQTINTAYILASYRTYGNLNQVMNRERNLYENRAVQMNNNINKLGNANNAVYLKQNMQKARVSFFISLTVVVALTVVALLLLDSVPNAANVIIGIAAVIITIFAVAFFVDTSGRVNTAGQKYYWGKPDVKGLN